MVGSNEQYENLWFQVVVPDDESLSGASIAEFVKLVLRKVPASVVAIVGANWLGELIGALKLESGRLYIVSTATLLERLPDITQIVWADFFFCHSDADARKISDIEPMAESIPKARFTLSTVDNTYFYLYTLDSELANSINGAYENVEISKGALTSFNYPY